MIELEKARLSNTYISKSTDSRSLATFEFIKRRIALYRLRYETALQTKKVFGMANDKIGELERSQAVLSYVVQDRANLDFRERSLANILSE